MWRNRVVCGLVVRMCRGFGFVVSGCDCGSRCVGVGVGVGVG